MRNLGDELRQRPFPIHPSKPDSLAVHAVGHTTVSGNAVSEVLDVEGALEAGGKEPAERRHEGREAGEDKDVE